jgi:3-deoxy-D-manno-octulosonate 8-phosphate phosphatase (KDO 8-P phosphatase)
MPPTEALAALRAVAFDIDGVLTDGGLWFGESGEVMRRFHALDGHGMKLLQQAGLRVVWITGRSSPINARRAAELGIDRLLQGSHDKRRDLREILSSWTFTPAECAYMGDDLIDLPAMLDCGLAATVAEAPAALRKCAHWVASRPAGSGAAREFCDWLLGARGQLDALVEAAASGQQSGGGRQ